MIKYGNDSIFHYVSNQVLSGGIIIAAGEDKPSGKASAVLKLSTRTARALLPLPSIIIILLVYSSLVSSIQSSSLHVFCLCIFCPSHLLSFASASRRKAPTLSEQIEVLKEVENSNENIFCFIFITDFKEMVPSLFPVREKNHKCCRP